MARRKKGGRSMFELPIGIDDPGIRAIAPRESGRSRGVDISPGEMFAMDVDPLQGLRMGKAPRAKKAKKKKGKGRTTRRPDPLYFFGEQAVSGIRGVGEAAKPAVRATPRFIGEKARGAASFVREKIEEPRQREIERGGEVLKKPLVAQKLKELKEEDDEIETLVPRRL